jgi:hypothetical protein
MSWSVTINDVQEFEKLDVSTEEYFSSQHPSYPRDVAAALAVAKAVGLRSATLSGMRTPNPYGGDEIVDVSVRGTPIYKDFLQEMQEIISNGPDERAELSKHFAALATLRIRPCAHIFEDAGNAEVPGLRRCAGCGVYLNGTMLYFEEKDHA